MHDSEQFTAERGNAKGEFMEHFHNKPVNLWMNSSTNVSVRKRTSSGMGANPKMLRQVRPNALLLWIKWTKFLPSFSPHGAELLKMHGELTHALRPAVSFIPTITLNGSQGRQASILKDLLQEVCKVDGGHPDVCQWNCNLSPRAPFNFSYLFLTLFLFNY